ncbi:MAG: DUF4139 domain-containing protein [Gemmatimonadales bacterium]
MTHIRRNAQLLAASAAMAITTTASAQQGPSFTFYADGRVLARRSFEGQVPAGPSSRTLALGEVDLGTVMSLDPGITVLGGRVSPGDGMDAALRRSVGKELRFLRERDTVRGTVIGADPLRIRLADGGVVFGTPGLPVFPADVAGGDPGVTLSLTAKQARPALPLGWYAQGGGWRANYSVLLSGQTGGRAGGQGARITGMAVVQAGALSADDAEVQLLAGDVGFEGVPLRPMLGRDAVAVAEAKAPGGFASEQAVGDAHLYTLPGRHQLRPGEQLSVALFEPAEVTAEKRYTVSGFMPFYGPLGQYGDAEHEVPVRITHVIPRAKKTAFGDVPLPGGSWRLFEPDAEGRLQLIGVAQEDHTAAGEELRLESGRAFDLTARRVETEYSQVREGRRTTATASYRVTIANAGKAAATVDVLEQRAGDWSVVSSSVPAEKLSSTITRFRVQVPAGGEATLTYQVQVRW